MLRTRELGAVAVLAAVLVASSCGSGRPSPTAPARTAAEALPRLKAMVDATTAVVARGFQVRPDTGFSPTGCDDSAGQANGTVSAPYSLMFALADGTDIAGLFDAARRYWKSHGYEVGTVNLQSFDPRLHAVRDGYELVLHVVPSRHMGYLGGGTPCLPER